MHAFLEIDWRSLHLRCVGTCFQSVKFSGKNANCPLPNHQCQKSGETGEKDSEADTEEIDDEVD